MDKDPFFMEKGSKRRRKEDEEDIESEEEEEDEFGSEGLRSDEENEEEGEEETAAEKKKRLAMAFLEKRREQARREEEEEEEDGEDDRVEKEGLRDSLVAKILQQEQLEESGRLRRKIASRYSLLIAKGINVAHIISDGNHDHCKHFYDFFFFGKGDGVM